MSGTPVPFRDNIVDENGKVTRIWQRFFESFVVTESANLQVGQLFFTTNTSSPEDILGYGTWEMFGTGRLVLDVDTGQPANSSSTVTIYVWRRTA